MCSQRSSECTRSRRGRCRRARGADAGSGLGCGASSSLLSTAILDTRPPDLLVAAEIRRYRLGAEREILLHELIAAVFARSLHDYAISALIDDVAAVVAPVPGDGVLPRQPGRAGDRLDEVR